MKKIRNVLFVLVIITLFAACTDTPRRTRNQSLSSAVEKSKEENPEDRKVNDKVIVYEERKSVIDEERKMELEREHKRRYEIENEKRAENDLRLTSSQAIKKEKRRGEMGVDSYGGISAGYCNELYGNNSISSVKSVSINLFGWQQEKFKEKNNTSDIGGLSLYLGGYEYGSNFKQKNDLDPTNMLGLGMYFNNQLYKFSDYFNFSGTLKFGVDAYFFNFKNPVFDSKETIRGDGFMAMKLGAGGGFIYRRHEDIFLKVEAVPQIFIPVGDTFQKFKNDLFPVSLGIGLNAEIGGL